MPTTTTITLAKPARPPHQHVCILCGIEWACRQRCENRPSRICIPCLKRRLEQTRSQRGQPR